MVQGGKYLGFMLETLEAIGIIGESVSGPAIDHAFQLANINERLYAGCDSGNSRVHEPGTGKR